MIAYITSDVVLKANELNSINHKTIILNHLKNQFEGQYSKHGYIFKDTIEVLSYSMGRIIQTHFNGVVRYDVTFKCELFDATPKSILKGLVVNKNIHGLTVSVIIHDVVIAQFIVLKTPESRNIASSEVNLDDINIGDEVLIEIQQKNSSLLGTKILKGLARIVKSDKKNVNAQLAAKEVIKNEIAVKNNKVDDLEGGNEDIDDEEEDEEDDDDDVKSSENEDDDKQTIDNNSEKVNEDEDMEDEDPIDDEVDDADDDVSGIED